MQWLWSQRQATSATTCHEIRGWLGGALFSFSFPPFFGGFLFVFFVYIEITKKKTHRPKNARSYRGGGREGLGSRPRGGGLGCWAGVVALLRRASPSFSSFHAPFASASTHARPTSANYVRGWRGRGFTPSACPERSPKLPRQQGKKRSPLPLHGG